MYKHVAMLASIIQNVYIDNNWVAQQYIERSKKGSQKKENTEEALKCPNLERIIDAEKQGRDIPDELRLEGFLNEEAGGGGGNNTDDAEAEDEVTSIDQANIGLITIQRGEQAAFIDQVATMCFRLVYHPRIVKDKMLLK